MGVDSQYLVELTRELFCSESKPDRVRLHFSDDETIPIALVENVLYELKMLDSNEKGVAVRLYLDIGAVGGELWTHEVRAMLRFSSAKHPALPRIRDGGVRTTSPDGPRIAFSVVDREGQDLGTPGYMGLVQKKKASTIIEFAKLADGLRLLHASGLSHRNLQPAAIEIITDPETDYFTLRLAKFETSGLEANLLLRSQNRQNHLQDYLKNQLARTGPGALAYFPPERLAALFPRGPLRIPPEHFTGDLFSLGVFAFVCFIENLSEDRLAAAFPLGAEGLYDYDHSAHIELLQWMTARVRSESSVPAPLRGLIEKMLHHSPFNRPTAYEVVDSLARNYEILAAWYSGAIEGRPYIVAIKPDEFRPTAYRWNWIAEEPSSPEGLAALRQFIKEDLKGGVLEYCSGGWAAVKGTDASEDRRADIVLYGKRAAYFGHLFESRLAYEERDRGVLLDEVIFIRQMMQNQGALGRRYQRPLFSRLLPPIEVLPWNSPRLTPSQARKNPKWKHLIEMVKVETPRPQEHKNFESALRFFLELQQVEIDARQYAFKREGLTQGQEASLIFDLDRDEQRQLNRPLLHLFCESTERRPAFGDFFGNLADQDSGSLVVYRPGGSNPSMDRDLAGTATVLRWEGTHRVRIRMSGEVPIPAEGWLEPADDGPARVVLDRQRLAFKELVEHPSLIGQLIKPHSLFDPSIGWIGAADKFNVECITRSGDGKESIVQKTIPRLQGRRSRKALQELLGYWPFYALQGPPGTGKTTLAARAVRAALLADPSLRILISAQSHFALDNFATTVLDYLPSEPEILALRVASQTTEEKVDPAVAPYLAKNLREKLSQSIHQRCQDRLRQRGNTARVTKLLIEWNQKVDDLLPEITDRVRRSSNLVFSTCGSATEEEVGTSSGLGLYDWVIIEEAAKAWPTELAVALVRGDRWTLIGDHRQLPAYRLREVLDILAACENGPEPLAAYAKNRDAYTDYLRLFESFFKSVPSQSEENDDDTEAEILEIGLKDRPVNRLNKQFRMAPPIAEVVSCFYDEPLANGKGVGGPHGIEVFGDASLVWLDTGEELDHVCEPCWYNEGEARTIANLFQAIRPLRHCYTEPQREKRLAILSPYRDQSDRLARTLPQEYRNLIHTVDSFQGREAQIVCVSLVRRRGGHIRPTATAQFGHLANLQRVNVLLSRAQRLLILVGDIQHFQDQEKLSEQRDAPFWLEVCNVVRQSGVVMSAAKAMRLAWEGGSDE